MWSPALPALERRHRVVRFDHRGHGRSPVPRGPYEIADLGGDVLALLDRLALERVSYAGVSLAGMVGLWLAAQCPRANRAPRLHLQLGPSAACAGMGGSGGGGDGGGQRRRRRRRRTRALVHARLCPVASPRCLGRGSVRCCAARRRRGTRHCSRRDRAPRSARDLARSPPRRLRSAPRRTRRYRRSTRARSRPRSVEHAWRCSRTARISLRSSAPTRLRN